MYLDPKELKHSKYQAMSFICGTYFVYLKLSESAKVYFINPDV